MNKRKMVRAGVGLCVVVGVLCRVTLGQYGGGTGTADDPYLIYTAEQMNAIGADPNDWDKHFLLMADIDLSGYTGTEFNIIGTGAHITWRHRSLEEPAIDATGGPFRGVFDGGGHAISNLTYTGANENNVGLFGRVEDADAVIRNLGLISPSVDVGTGHQVGSLVGNITTGTIEDCYVHGGIVRGQGRVGGLIGSHGQVRGYGNSTVTGCYATAIVIGDSWIGGLIGSGSGPIANCYATGTVIGGEYVSGLVGQSGATIENCYAAGVVLGDQYVGGLVGEGQRHEVSDSFWDVQTSRQATSANGEGKTTAQMQRAFTFRAWGEGDSAGVWTIDEGKDYPRLAWENQPGIVIDALAFSDLVAGTGTAEDPYLIHIVDDLALVASEPNAWDKHFKLMADIDLSAHPGVGFTVGWGGPNSRPFTGVFDGNGHTISNFSYVEEEEAPAGFFAYVENPYVRSARGGMERDPNAPGAVIENLGLLSPVVDGRAGHVAGALIGDLYTGTVRNCYIEGGLVLGGREETGGLVGVSFGTVRGCYVVGGTVIGTRGTGGLMGGNVGEVTDCYSTSTVIGTWRTGGLVGRNSGRGQIINCFATGRVVGTTEVGGLAGTNEGSVTASFWNVETSGQASSAGGTGSMTVEMMRAGPFLEAGWDFVGEVENGTEDVWWILEGEDYPRLWWEGGEESPLWIEQQDAKSKTRSFDFWIPACAGMTVAGRAATLHVL
ncbi:MAG: GLUG motif-containing protein [Planctomycetota bacterium]|jgi:hypothetical protein